ncbi:MAG: hypothetical protein ACKO26_05895 [Planctomycetota bacterium]
MKIKPILLLSVLSWSICGCGESSPNVDPKPADPSKAPVLKQLKAGGEGEPKSVMKQN